MKLNNLYQCKHYLSVTFSTRPAEQRTKYLYDASGRKLQTTYQTSRYASLGPGDLVHVDTLELNPDIWDHIETGVLRPLSSPGFGDAMGSLRDDLPHIAEEALWSTSYVRDYCGDIIYKDGEIERILTDNGYAVPDSAGGYDYYYYIKDWQGNVRAVIDEANRRMELNNYYPYGMPMSSTASVQPYKYGGKELDRTNGLDMYDFGARWYDMIVPHFITIDPLAEKYPSISPYAYCAGNPIRYIDPDGRRVIFAANQTDEFKQQFGFAIQIMNKYDISGIFSELESNSQTIRIAFGEETKFDANNMTIYWNPKQGILTNELVSLSPITLLNHEGDHGLRFMLDPEGMMKDKRTSHPDYSNMEEKRVIEGSEQKTAEALGEVEKGKPTRKDHWGNKITVSSPDSNKDINEFVIIGVKKK